MPARRAPDPFKKLEFDHRRMAALLKRIERLPDDAKEECDQLFDELKLTLLTHTEIEEKVVYPRLREIRTARDLTFEAFEEHHVITTLLEELDTDDLDPEVWMAKFTVFRENIEHHVQEEEKKLFPKARRALKAAEKEQMHFDMNLVLTPSQ